MCLQKSDYLLRWALLSITNNTLSDSQWLHVSLLIRSGDLGIIVTLLALPAFLASATSTLLLQNENQSLSALIARAKLEVAQPIRCRLRAFFLLIRYVTLLP